MNQNGLSGIVGLLMLSASFPVQANQYPSVDVITIQHQANTAMNLDWSQLTYGLRPEQVRQRYPQLQAQAEERLADGSVSLLGAEAVTFRGAVYSAAFYFLDQRLTQVHLSGDMMAENDDNRQQLAELTRYFNDRYGQPVGSRIKDESWGLSAKVHWQAAKVSQWIAIVPTTGAQSLLKIGYVLRP